ncbi:MAG TPA: MbcA/ParS/Xre antitoxin family protein [Polyangiaceae bacterium]|nr:MbcA/ParS/Xre antitoxin family protein [Polyangiaceae bacterium]
MYVGDHPDTDVAGAAAAGFWLAGTSARNSAPVQILTNRRIKFILGLMLPNTNSEKRVHLDDPRASAVAKKAFFRIMDLWGVSNEQAQVLLGNPSRSTFFGWKKGEGGNLSRDTFERVSYVIGIYKALQILFNEDERADAWMAKPNDAFGGKSALDRMLAGNVGDLHVVRAYLDHARGGGS